MASNSLGLILERKRNDLSRALTPSAACQNNRQLADSLEVNEMLQLHSSQEFKSLLDHLFSNRSEENVPWRVLLDLEPLVRHSSSLANAIAVSTHSESNVGFCWGPLLLVIKVQPCHLSIY